ncbi:hypothetical protein E1B28_004444 [Marasmius oreades]|uniref:DUF7719 domain-containing protein n=1 Tax=Marasmius oreades TaxID=181124 RepID=A0A9P7UYS3_9AGAR|nr:uncharacterized protein E1B28_004444 [Marasmius oreades]KAG7097053.1 hypothetical protein E1B28_004444 [Marasmius oreades]
MDRRRQEKPLESTPAQEMPEDEQWRLVNQSGILSKIPEAPKQKTLLEEEAPLANEILDATLYIIPFSTLLLVMDVIIHNQYGEYPPLKEFAGRMASGVPILGLFVFYTKRHQDNRRTKFLMFLLSVCVGPRLLYILARSSFTVNIRQAPPLITLWIYTIVQLDLGPAFLNLVICGLFVWWKDLRRYLI